MLKIIRAFTLIELMVTIAIVAILAAAALPAYRTYLLRAHLATTLPTMDALAKQAFAYLNANGYFPNAKQLGYDSVGGLDIAMLHPADFNPILSNIFVYDDSTAAGYAAPCGAILTIFFQFNAPLFDDDGSNAGAQVSCAWWNKGSGEYNNVCWYEYPYAGNINFHTEELMPQWMNNCQTSTACSQITPTWANIIASAQCL